MSQLIVSGRFLQAEGTGERFLIKGVGYGTFAPDADGALFPGAGRVARDFDAIAELGANTIRTYTPPSLDILDEAARRGLRVIVGMPWPQHIAFLDGRRIARQIQAAMRRHVRQLAPHPASLLFCLGNEIPPGVVRWYGRRRIEEFLRELFDEAKADAPDALFTYVNYPPTEYLETPFFDVCAFNVFLHREAELGAYLAHLHHIAGHRPLLIAEAGADSLRNGEQRQAALVTMQLRTAFGEGACGAIVFSWTDEWWRGGRPVDDWAFGLVDADRRPKLAYHAVQRVFGSAPFQERQRDAWPRVSVVICAYNAADTIDECLTAIEALDYPDFEVIVVNDGSADDTGAIAARRARVRVVHIPNSGLAAARNVGLEHATGDIVAYTDADVRVDPDWLTYLVQPFITSDVVAAGGPNIVPADDPWLAQAVARAPGGPTHVLLDDRVAEHVPGCNCAFRRDALLAIGGFNPIFLRAGDDVDVCWRLQARGWTIGFAPAALVWHHHRTTVRGYVRQQIGYGEGETWLMREHPEKFVRGRMAWRGHIYSPLPFIRSLSAMRINAGPFGSAAFPSIYRTDAHPFAYLPHSGRWQVAWVLLFALAAPAGYAGAPYAAALAGAGSIAMIATLIKCLLYGWRSEVTSLPAIGRLSRRSSRAAYHVTIAALHFLQPFARLYGRIRGAISRPGCKRPSTGRGRRMSVPRVALTNFADGARLCLGRKVEKAFWSERWIDVPSLLHAIADRLRRQRAVRQIDVDGGWWEDRDLTIVDRAWFRLDVRALLEDHGGGRCLCRLGIRSRVTGAAVVPLLLGAAAVAVLHGAGIAGWPSGAAVVGVLAAAIALVEMIVASRIVANAVGNVAAECGMLPLDADGKGRPLPADPPAGAPHGATPEAWPKGPAVLKVLPPDLSTAARAGARKAGTFVVLLALIAPAFAQAPDTGGLHGTVTDQTGGVVGGASVAIENSTARKWTVETDRQGRYVFERVPPGPYRLTVAATGFLEFTSPIVLGPDAPAPFDIGLKVGLSVTVEVREPSGLSTDPRKNSSAVILTRRQIDGLPDNPRLFLNRLLQMAGSTGRRGDVAVYVDGFREYKRMPPKDTIEMIRINSNPFSAEFSQPSVKRIEITTKPGSDGLHGDVRLQLRSSRLDARNPLAEAKPLGEYRNYNGYLQGPLQKERVGFLLYAGQWRQDDNAFVHATVLDSATALAQPFASTVSTPVTVTSAMLKTDVTLFDQTINASYTRTDETQRNQGLNGGFDLPEHAYDRSSRDDVGRLWWTSVGGRSVNDLRFELTRSHAASSARTAAPAVIVLDAFGAGGDQNAASRTATTMLQGVETFTVLKGAHTLKAGVQGETTDQASVDRTGFGGAFTFGADVERDRSGAPLLNALRQQVSISPIENYRRTVVGLPGYGPTQFAIVTGDPDVGVSQWDAGWFVLDDWSISKRVSLSYGVRQELQNNVKLRANLAPRASLSWLVDAKGNNALKLGAGLFYSRVEPAITFDARKLDGARRQQFIVRRPSFFAEIPSAFDLAARARSTVYVKSDDLRAASSLVATLSYERQLPHGLFAVAEYLYGRGVHQLRLREIARPSGAATSAPVLQFESTGRSRQHELMLGLRGDVGTRLSLYGNYRLGRKDGDTDGAYTIPADSNDLSTEYGASADDRRHQLVAGATLQPFGGLVIEPAVTVASGRPFNITTGHDNNGDTFFTDRPSFAVAGQAGAVATPLGLFNPNPGPGDLIVPRNFGREPWEVSVDLAVSKTLRQGLTITADAENLLNATRFVRFNGVLTSPVFGMPNQALNARRLELSIRYGF